MVLYRYVKAGSQVMVLSESLPQVGVGGLEMAWDGEVRTGKFSWGVAAAAVLMVVGGGLLSFSVAPIVAYEVVVSPRMVAPLLSPLGREGLVLGGSNGEKGEDLTQASKWFPSAPAIVEETKISTYSLWVPKLGIEGATVTVGGDDLSHSLVHYGGTALPGQPGNAVIFGHSVLPQFYNPKNYMTIFSTLPTLRKGDEFVVNLDGVTYRYLVEEMFEVQPADIQILEQKYSDSYLTVVTCVPPGTYMRRLVVRARLVRPEGGGERRRVGE